MTNKEMEEQISRLDFDPQNTAQKRVWARLARPRAPMRRKNTLLWGACGAFLLALGALIGSHWNPAFHGPHQTPGAALSEEDCIDLNSRHLLATALEYNEENCSCRTDLTVYDKQTLQHLRQELNKFAVHGFTPEDQTKLHECNAKYKPQLHTFAPCKTQC